MRRCGPERQHRDRERKRYRERETGREGRGRVGNGDKEVKASGVWERGRLGGMGGGGGGWEAGREGREGRKEGRKKRKNHKVKKERTALEPQTEHNDNRGQQRQKELGWASCVPGDSRDLSHGDTGTPQ